METISSRETALINGLDPSRTASILLIPESPSPGFSVQATDTVKETGSNNGSNPMAIFEILKKVARGGE